MKLNLLHICNGYMGSPLYKNLFLKIADLKNVEIFQKVFVPLRGIKATSSIQKENENIEIHYFSIVTSIIYRLFFYLKVKKSYNQIVTTNLVEGVNTVHAHTLFSDGAIALKLKKNFGIPYLVAVRNTDVNIFLKYLIYLKPLGNEILMEAKNIVFLSNSYKERLFNIYSNINEEMKEKSFVIPNGIDSFWMQNIYTESKNLDKRFRIIYVGQLNHNKNVHSIIDAAINLKKEIPNLGLTIVGGTGERSAYHESLLNRIESKDYIKIKPRMNFDELKNEYSNHHVFVMPSFNETFGLVYAEAISQGLPVIYTKGEGFDKFFEEGEVGYSVDPSSIIDITLKLKEVYTNYKDLQPVVHKKVNNFSWDKVAVEYFKMYI